MARPWLRFICLLVVIAPVAVRAVGDPAAALAAAGDITTYAGGGAGDGGAPTNAALNPNAVAVGPSGDIYIADALHCRVRKISSGVITTVAGTGVCGFSGDGGSALAAQIDGPTGVAISATGDVYISDTNNCRIRKVAAGTITTVAGSGVCIFGGDGGPAASGSLASPRGIALDPSSGALYIADHGNCRVRKIAGGIITTAAGNGACGFSGDGVAATATGVGHAQGVAVDASGTLYIADTSSCRVRIVPYPAGTIFTIAGNGTCGFAGDGGPGTSAQVASPRGVATDAAGDVYIADTGNCRIRKVTYPAISISTVAGTSCGYSGDGGAATSAQLHDPSAVVIAGSSVVIADTGNCRLRTIAAGVIATSAGTGGCSYGGDGDLATDATFGSLGEVAIDSAGNLFVADLYNCRVREVASGGTVTTIAGTGACSFSGDGGLATSAAFNQPRGIAVDSTGNLYIADTNNCRIRKRTAATGVVTTLAGNGTCGYGGDNGPATAASLNYPESVAISGTTVYIADTFNCRIRKVVGTTISTLAGTGGCTYGGDGGLPASARVAFPYGVAADAQGSVYVADTYNCRIRKISGGSIATIAGTGTCAFGGDDGAAISATVNHPTGVAVTSAGAVYVADTDNCRVRLISGGVILTAAGTGTGVSFGNCGFAGDGGAASSAVLDRPQGVAIDSSGNAFIADGLNARVRKIAVGADADADGVGDATDNCPTIANPSQSNNDRNFIDQTPPKSVDDLTLVNSDEIGDACDPDDDNDGIPDTVESAGPPCASASGPTNPLLADTDGDRRLDGAECALGTDPANAASFPPTIVGPDADSDGLPDALDPNDANVDTDGDGLRDGVEFRYYNSNVNGVNTDGDATRDDCEAASLNADTTVNSGDQGLLASEVLMPPPGLVNFDINKDGTINSGRSGVSGEPRPARRLLKRYVAGFRMGDLGT